MLGKTGLKVSALGFGASSLGGGVFRAVERTRSHPHRSHRTRSGINIIDVSPFYGYTRAETVLGKALREFREINIVWQPRWDGMATQNSIFPQSG